tara:strand:+ start:436 stop:885 length:450 start_codon:yes stop_codon:yes gene_type:complete
MINKTTIGDKKMVYTDDGIKNETFVKENFSYEGEYLMYNTVLPLNNYDKSVQGNKNRLFIGRWKYGNGGLFQLGTKAEVIKELIKNWSVKEYMDAMNKDYSSALCHCKEKNPTWWRALKLKRDAKMLLELGVTYEEYMSERKVSYTIAR